MKYSLIIEATEDPSFFTFYSPDIEGFTGVGNSIEDCLYKAKWGMEEHIALLKERGLPFPKTNPNPDIVIKNAKLFGAHTLSISKANPNPDIMIKNAELLGEHEAIIAYMHALTKSLEGVAEKTVNVKERLWSYRCNLHDLKDAIWYHIEIDERIFKSLLGDTYPENPVEEHREIKQLVNDMIMLADNAAIENLEQAQLNEYYAKLRTAFDRIRKLIEMHIAKENSILERIQKSPEHQQV